MRILLITGSLALVIAAFFCGFQLGALQTSAVCVPDEPCVREWLAATSGWAAAIVAAPTILYLSKQIRDADRHQKTAFAIQLRQRRILATRTCHIARIALSEMDKQESEHADANIRSWDRETIEGIIHHLRDTTISSFQNEIAHPHSLGAWVTSLAVERAYAGIEPALQTAPGLTRKFFENLAKQADEYLIETEAMTGIKSS